MERSSQGSNEITLSSTLQRLHEYRENEADQRRDSEELWKAREIQFNRALSLLDGQEVVDHDAISRKHTTPHRETPILQIPLEEGGSIPVKLVEYTSPDRDAATENHTGTYTPYMVKIEYWETGVGDDSVAVTPLYELQTHVVRSFDYKRSTQETDNSHEWQILAEATKYLDAIQSTLQK